MIFLAFLWKGRVGDVLILYFCGRISCVRKHVCQLNFFGGCATVSALIVAFHMSEKSVISCLQLGELLLKIITRIQSVQSSHVSL
jgi:hypothetical protein